MDELGDFLQGQASQGYDFGDLSGLGALTQASQTQDRAPASDLTANLNSGPLESLYQQPGMSSSPGDGGGAGGVGGGGQEASPAAATQSAPAEKQNSLLKALGVMATADGTASDFGDPKSLMVLLKGLGIGGSFLQQVLSKGQTKSAQTGAQLQAQLAPNPYNAWNPAQAAVANRLFTQGLVAPQNRARQYAGDMQSPIVAGRGYAEGGEVLGEDGGSEQGPLGLVAGSGMGQADDVPVNLSGGEYVFDADTVAALGDGNNSAGAKKLDELREAIRRQKRAAAPDQIPPPAKDPMQYMKD